MHIKSKSYLYVVLLLLLIPAAAGRAAAVYQIDVDYDAASRELYGTLSVEMETLPSTAYFLLLPNFDAQKNPYVSARTLDATYPYGFEPSRLDVLAVRNTTGGAADAIPFRRLALPPVFQTYSLDGTVLAVDVPSGVTRIEIDFLTTVPRNALGDNGITAGILTWRFGWFPIYLDLSPRLADQNGVVILPDHAPLPLIFPRGTYEATLTVPAGMDVFSGANQGDVPSPPEDAPATEDAAQQVSLIHDGPTRSLALVIGEGYSTYTLEGPTTIEVAFLEGHEAEARRLATYAREILAEYGARYGEYPHRRLTLVENPNQRGDAFSADGIVWLSSWFFTHRHVLLPEILDRFTEFVLAHEIAHQWFGMGTGVDLDADGWLSEGLSQYLSVSYFERQYGAFEPNLLGVHGAGLIEEFVEQQFGYLNLREHTVELPYLVMLWDRFDEALVKPAIDVKYENATPVRLYDKGYLVARALSAYVGEDAFDRALRGAVSAYADGVLTSTEFRDVVEQESGASLGAWFDAWVFGETTADYAVEIVSRTRIEETYETVVRVTRSGGVEQDVLVEAVLVSGATTQQVWNGALEEDQIVFRTPSAVTRVTIDPEHRLPDRDRINNNDPVKFVAALQRASLPLDAYVIVPDSVSGAITLSRLDRFRVSVNQDGASLALKDGRNSELDAAVSIATPELTGSVVYTYTTYDHPNIGTPGTYWESDLALSIAGERIVSEEEPLYVLRVGLVDLPSIVDSGIRSLAFDVASTGSARFAVSAFDEIRLFPRVYLQGIGFLGFGLGEVPARLRFGFSDLRSIKVPAADNKVSGALALEVPASDAMPYNLLNLAMIDRSRLRLFVAGGIGWTSPGRFGTTSPKAEAGIEGIFDVSTLGGLLPLTVRVGAAIPITGAPVPTIYVNVSL